MSLGGGDQLGTVFVEVRAELSKLKSDFSEAFAATEAESRSFGQRIGAMLSPHNLMVGGMALTAIGAPLEHLGNQLEQSEKQLKAAADAAGMSEEQLSSNTKGLVGHMENLGHTQTQTNEALRSFVQAGRPAAELHKDMSLAADLAAAKHMSLAAAANLLAKVYGGNTRVLKQFGIDLKSLSDPQKDLTTAQNDATKAADALGKATESNRLAHERAAGSKKMSAAASDALRINDAKLKEAQDQVRITSDNLKKAQEGAASGSTKAGNAIDELSKKLHGQGAAAVDTFGGKIHVLRTHLEDMAAHVGSKLGPVLMTLGPIMAGAGGAAQVFGMFTAGAGASAAVAGAEAGAASGGFMAMAAGVWAAMAPILPIIALLAALAAAAYLLYKNWDSVWGFIKDIVGGAAGWISDHLHMIEYVLGGPLAPLFFLFNNWKKIWDGIGNIISDVWNTISGIVDDIIGAVEKVTSAISHLPGAGVIKGIGGMLGFAAGGTVPGPVGQARLAVVHGGEEVRPYGNTGGSGGGGGPTAVFNIAGSVIAERELLSLVRSGLDRVKRANGRVGL